MRTGQSICRSGTRACRVIDRLHRPLYCIDDLSLDMPFRILVGSYTNEIYTVSFDPDALKLTLESTLTVGHHPSWITPHPTDPSVVFTGLEQDGGKAFVIRYDAEGKGTVVGNAPSGGADPCTLLARGTELLIGNVSSLRRLSWFVGNLYAPSTHPGISQLSPYRTSPRIWLRSRALSSISRVQARIRTDRRVRIRTKFIYIPPAESCSSPTLART